MNIHPLIPLIVSVVSLTAHPLCANNSEKRIKVGLVSGGSGTKGAAEVGVLKVIERSGINIDYIAGTGIGSITGGLHAAGCRSASLNSILRSLEWVMLLSDREKKYKNKLVTVEDGVNYIPGFPISYKNRVKTAHSFGAVRGDNVINLSDSMTHHINSVDFDKLPIPFRCIASDMKHHHEVVFSKGRLPTAMRAGMSIPETFKPELTGNVNSSDRVMLNNLPVDAVRGTGADVVISVGLTHKKRKAKNFSLKEDTSIGVIPDRAVSRPDLVKYNADQNDADVYINPDSNGYNAGSFNARKISKMIEIGEKAGKKTFNTLKRSRKESILPQNDENSHTRHWNDCR